MKPGFHKLTREQYDKADGIRNTEIGWAARSMAHYKFNRENGGSKSTDAKEDGILIHRAILEPDIFERDTVILPVDAPKYPTKAQLNAKKNSPESAAAISWWHHFGSVNAGKTIIDKADCQRIQDIAGAVLNDPQASEIIASCKRRELAVFSRHEATGLLLKSQFDLVTDDDLNIWDLKFVADSEPEKYRKSVLQFGYHRQSAYYPDHFPRLGLKRPAFGQIIAEKDAPYIVSVRPFCEDSAQVGRLEYNAILHEIANCLVTKRYPGYRRGNEETGIPVYKLREILG